MVNLTVVNLKDVIKYLVKVTLVIVIIVAITRFFCSIKNNKTENLSTQQNLIYAIKEVIPGVKQFFKTDNNTINIGDTYKIALNSELEIAKKITSRTQTSTREEETIIEEQENNNENTIIENVENIQTGVATEVLDSKYNVYSSELYGVKIKNESIHQLIENEYNMNNSIPNKNNILIFHTHTCESYTASENYQYQSTGNYRTTDLSFSVARVGDELEKYLKEFGFNVFHDKTYHDYPAYSGSYGRSLKTVQKLLGVYKDTDIVIDLHRDAIGDNTYAPKVKIGDEVGAQLMFVIGTDGSGLTHTNWRKNLEFAIQVQKKANEMYPGLFKPILVRNSRYNQQVSSCACIIEVGATGNTMEECLVSMKYLSKVFAEI